MVMISDKQGVEQYSLSTRLYELVERIKQKIHQEDSMVLGIIFGKVGCGKSVRAQQIAYAVDPELDITRVDFDKVEFIDAILASEKRAIVADEGISIFFSRAAMTKEGRLVAELMAQIRQKNLFVLICVPDILSIDAIVIEAANFVAYVWEDVVEVNGKNVTRKGNMELYPELPDNRYKTKIISYLKLKRSNPFRKIMKPHPYLVESGSYVGETYKKPWYPVGEKEYRKKKEGVLEKYRQRKKTINSKPEEKRHVIKREVVQNIISAIKSKKPDLTDKEIGELIGYSRSRVTELRARVESRGSTGTDINTFAVGESPADLDEERDSLFGDLEEENEEGVEE